MPYQHVQVNERPARAARAAAQIVTRAVVNEEASGEAALLPPRTRACAASWPCSARCSRRGRRDAARLRACQHAALRTCSNVMKQCGRTMSRCAASPFAWQRGRRAAPAAPRCISETAPAARRACLQPALCATASATPPAPPAHTPPAKPAAAQPRAATAAEGVRAAEDGGAGAEAERAERDAAWAERLAAALDINTALEAGLAELRAQNARLRRRARGP